MSKEMNKLNYQIIKYDLLIGLFLSLIIGRLFSIKCALILILGLIVSLLNYLVGGYVISKWFFNANLRVLLVTIVRILLVALLIIPFADNRTFVITYIIGFTMHYLILISCTIMEKGSA